MTENEAIMAEDQQLSGLSLFGFIKALVAIYFVAMFGTKK